MQILLTGIVCVCVHMYVYIYIYTHTHTYAVSPINKYTNKKFYKKLIFMETF